MKTKILLSVLAILSISFIGLARPGNSSGSHAEAVSPENATVMASIDSEEAPIITQDQDKKEQKKEVKKKVKKEDEEKEKTILVWTAKEGEKGTHEIIIDKKNPKKIIFVTSPHAEHDKDTKAYWTIKSDKLHLSEDVKTIKLDKGAVIHIKKGDKEGVEVIELEPDHVTVDVHVSPHVEVHPKVHVVIDTEKYAKLIEKIKEKLAKLKEKDLDSDVKEVELEGIEKTLEKLRKALEKKSEKTEHVDVNIRHKDSHSYRIKTKDVHIDGEKGYQTIKITDDKAAFSLIYHAELDVDQKDAYEKAIKKLEGNLPEGYDLESTFDEDKGTLLIKITEEKDTVEYNEAVESIDVLKKLIHEFQEELGKIKK